MALDFPANPSTGQQFTGAGAVWIWNGTSWTSNPAAITPDIAGSAPGTTQPVIVSGGVSLPPSFPLPPAGTWMPPPTVGNPVGVPTFPPTVGSAPVPIPPTTPFATPVVPPGTGTGIAQPQYKSGSATVPTAASLFAAYTAPGPVQPIVLTNQMQIGLGPPPYTTGTTPVSVPLAAPVNTVPPHAIKLSGSGVGSALYCSPGGWFPSTGTTYTYQWLRDGANISGATSRNYTTVSADTGHLLSCRVTATNTAGSNAAISNSLGPALLDAEEPETPPPDVEHVDDPAPLVVKKGSGTIPPRKKR